MSLVFIVLNVSDGIESKYPSIVFLSILTQCLTFDAVYISSTFFITDLF